MNNLGNIKIADDVVKTIAAKATEDVEGVYKLAGGVADEFGKILGKKRGINGIKVEVGEKECSIDTYIIIKHGYPISEVAQKVQESVLESVSRLTALKVIEVNVFVQDIKIEDEKVIKEEAQSTDEIE
ncbi:Asp23/Gls24 family envelope stress response protein [Fusobacterium sp.]|uniref:Asp23/Gls24 family envelope stress response protein n=1 Tax=Fusobacterium sp. TaxID=68766 RepID=UPI0026317A68|nr:Asp23/Gls24 family envelope stress response protein [Fusobacterium sp.]